MKNRPRIFHEFTNAVRNSGIRGSHSWMVVVTCDGPPYDYKVAYEEAERMLEELK